MMGENSRKLAVRRGWARLVQRGPKLIAASNIQAYLPDAVASVDIGQQLQQQQVSEEEEGEEEEGEEAPSGTLSEGESEADSLSEEDASAADNPQSEVEASAAGSLSEEEAPGADTPQSKGEASATGSLQPEGVTAAGCLQSKGEAATGWLQFEGEAAMGSLSELKPGQCSAAHLCCHSERISSPCPAWAHCRGSLNGLTAARLRRGRRQPTGRLHWKA